MPIQATMTYCKVTACVIVEDKDSISVNEYFQQTIDQLVRDRIPVFMSDIATVANCDVHEAEQGRQEVQ